MDYLGEANLPPISHTEVLKLLNETDFCVMCGARNEIEVCKNLSERYYGNVTVFCKNKRCRFEYLEHVGRKTDLRNGIPYLWTLQANGDPSYCKIGKKSARLSCDYCGKCDSQIVSHPRVPLKYDATNFCRNSICYKNFRRYVEAIETVPIKMTTASQSQKQQQQPEIAAKNHHSKGGRTAAAATRAVQLSKKKMKSSHHHSLNLELVIQSIVDEDAHKDVCLWCPKKDQELNVFRNHLLGAFIDYTNDNETVERLLKKVKCSI